MNDTILTYLLILAAVAATLIGVGAVLYVWCGVLEVWKETHPKEKKQQGD